MQHAQRKETFGALIKKQDKKEKKQTCISKEIQQIFQGGSAARKISRYENICC